MNYIRDKYPHLYKKEYRKNIKLKHLYNIDINIYNNILLLQNNSCAICKRDKNNFKKDLQVDHCHTTGKVRGLLCQKCNNGIGYFKDNCNLFLSAIDYIENPFVIKNNVKFENEVKFRLNSNIRIPNKIFNERENQIWSKYKMLNKDFEMLLNLQNKKCCICKTDSNFKCGKTKKVKPLFIDHDHKTKKVRGLLCSACNSGVGYFNDNIDLLNSAIKYLERND